MKCTDALYLIWYIFARLWITLKTFNFGRSWYVFDFLTPWCVQSRRNSIFLRHQALTKSSNWGFFCSSSRSTFWGGIILVVFIRGTKMHIFIYFLIWPITDHQSYFEKWSQSGGAPSLHNSSSQNCLIIWIFPDNNVVPPPPKKQTADLSIKWIKLTNSSPDLLLQVSIQTPGP